jgi:hypothetical protein
MRFCAAFRDLIGPLSRTIKMSMSHITMPSILCFDSHGLFLRRLPFNVKNVSVGDYCMIVAYLFRHMVGYAAWSPVRMAGWFADRCSALFCVWKFFFTPPDHLLTSAVSKMKIFWLGLVIGNIYLVYR